MSYLLRSAIFLEIVTLGTLIFYVRQVFKSEKRFKMVLKNKAALQKTVSELVAAEDIQAGDAVGLNLDTGMVVKLEHTKGRM